MSKIKICGLIQPCDIDAINSAMPEYIGFVFADSRRRVTPHQAWELRQRLHPDIIPVGVFVNELIEHVLTLAQNGIIDIIQLHGMEDEEYIKKLKTLTDKPIIKAIAVQNKSDAHKRTAADYLLLDGKDGGTGQSFDWNLIENCMPDKSFFLAGGLCIDNITEAIRKINPFAVDVSSGVETNDFKDPAKIKEFVRRIRNV